VALLKFSRQHWYDRIPLFGRKGAPFERLIEKEDGKLKIREAGRSDKALEGLLGFDEFAYSRVPVKDGKAKVSGDRVVIDTGKKLVQIAADKLDLAGVKKGDRAEFHLGYAVDPGGMTRIVGKVVAVIDGPDPTPAQLKVVSRAEGRKAANLERPLATDDPVADLIARRALLFQTFMAGGLDQDRLKHTWDTLRTEAVALITGGTWTYFEKQAALQELLDIGAFTPDEALGMGFQVVSNALDFLDVATG